MCDHFAPIEHIDRIDMLDGRESMGNDDRGASFHKFLERILYESLGFRIESTRRFIKDQDIRICEDCPSDSYTLFFTTREFKSTFSDFRVPCVWKRLDKVENIRFFTSLFEILIGDSITYIFKIMTDRFIKKCRILEY